MKHSLRLIGNLLFILILFAILYSYAMFQGGFVSWFLFFSFLPIFFYQLGLLFYPMKRWNVRRILSRQTIQAGDSIFVTIKIERFLPFPLSYCIVEEVLPQTLQKIDNRYKKYAYLNNPEKLTVHRQFKKMIFPWFRRKIELTYKLDQIPRGEHKLHEIRIRTGDIFGFVSKESHFKVFNVILTFPNRRQILLRNRFTHMQQGTAISNVWDTKYTNVVTGVREYSPGDKYSWINWKQTAKNNKMMTKEFEIEKSTDLLIVLDVCNGEHLNPLAFEGAIEFTNSLMIEIEKEKRPSQVGLLTIGNRVERFFISNDFKQVAQARQYLMKVQPTACEQSFASQLQATLTTLNSPQMIFLVITNMDYTLMQAIRRLTHRSKKIVVLMIQSKIRNQLEERNMMKQLQREGVIIRLFTEHELMQKKLEVNI